MEEYSGESLKDKRITVEQLGKIAYEMTREEQNAMVRDAYYEAFDNNREDMEKRIVPYVEKINDYVRKSIVDAYHESLKDGCKETIRLLSHILEIKRPDLVIADIDSPGLYSEKNNTVTLNVNLPRDLQEKTTLLKKKPTVLGIVAHEMWHAYQHDVARKGDTPEAEMYREEILKYREVACMDTFRKRRDVQTRINYVTQPMEMEANLFAELVEEKLRVIRPE